MYICAKQLHQFKEEITFNLQLSSLSNFSMNVQEVSEPNKRKQHRNNIFKKKNKQMNLSSAKISFKHLFLTMQRFDF